MAHTEINITALIENPDFCPSDFSASIAEIGNNAGPDTWRACVEWVADSPVVSPDALDCVRDYMKSSGGWNSEEISAMRDNELQALALQIIAGDLRNGFRLRFGVVPAVSALDWPAYQQGAEQGRWNSTFCRDDEGQVFAMIGGD
jgi:hypothetical protein